MGEGILMMKINGEIKYFNLEEIYELLSEGDTYEEQKNSNLQQEEQVC